MTAAAGGKATSAPLMGRDPEPTLFELSAPGKRPLTRRLTLEAGVKGRVEPVVLEPLMVPRPPEKVRLVPYFSRFDALNRDPDGNANFNGIDFTKGRNHFLAPSFFNLDMRIAKRIDFGERIRLHAYLEFFNLFNRGNPAAVNGLPPASLNSGAPQFGQVLQVLPGREGQMGIKVEF